MADEPDNIRDFKEMSGRILGTLYATHPKPIFYDFEAFFDDQGSEKEVDLFDDTLMYLVENGYLTQGRDSHVRLNDRSYQVLQKPDPLKEEEAIGASLARWAKGTASDTGRAAITEAAGAALTMLYTVLKGSVGG